MRAAGHCHPALPNVAAVAQEEIDSGFHICHSLAEGLISTLMQVWFDHAVQPEHRTLQPELQVNVL